MKTVFLFSGQGSQHRKMGELLYQNSPVFRKEFDYFDELLNRISSRSLHHELFEKDSEFVELMITHPAIVAIELATLEFLKSAGIFPDVIVGTSLGSFAAGVAAGVWSKEMAFVTAIEQANCIQKNCNKGKMIAVLSHWNEEFEQILKETGTYLSSINFNRHFTTSGELKEMNALISVLKEKKIKYIELPIEYAFHSPKIKEAKSSFLFNISSIELKEIDASIEWIDVKEVKEKKTINRDYFWTAVEEFSNWQNVIQHIENKGEFRYIDLGPCGTMAAFTKRCLEKHSTSEIYAINSLSNKSYSKVDQMIQQCTNQPNKVGDF